MPKSQLAIFTVEFCAHNHNCDPLTLTSLLEHNERKNQVAEGKGPCPPSLFFFCAQRVGK